MPVTQEQPQTPSVGWMPPDHLARDDGVLQQRHNDFARVIVAPVCTEGPRDLGHLTDFIRVHSATA